LLGVTEVSGAKGWKDFREFISIANNNCNWLVLRNFEYLPDDFFENDKDVDILCEDLDSFVKIMRLTKRSWGVAAYECIIGNQVVPFDVRFLGDGYYDKLWQYKMLENKIYTSDEVPRMNDKDYFYSLVYHCKLQKYKLKEVYKIRLNCLAKSLGVNDCKIDCVNNDGYIAKVLSDFMKNNSYSYSTPIDVNVIKNRNFFNCLDVLVKDGVSTKPPLGARFLRYVPSLIFKIFPYQLKIVIKKFLKWN